MCCVCLGLELADLAPMPPNQLLTQWQLWFGCGLAAGGLGWLIQEPT